MFGANSSIINATAKETIDEAAAWAKGEKAEKADPGETADWPADVAGWKAPAAGEHPRLLFRKADLPELKKRAQTPEGKAFAQKVFAKAKPVVVVVVKTQRKSGSTARNAPASFSAMCTSPTLTACSHVDFCFPRRARSSPSFLRRPCAR